MSVSLDSVINLIIVSILWGATNPFMKKGAKGVNDVEASSGVKTFFKQIIYLIKNMKYLIPFLINQVGSVLYFLTLKDTELSVAVPVTNSLTFLFTAIAGWILGEERPHKSTYLGMILILIGTYLCCIDKINIHPELEEIME